MGKIGTTIVFGKYSNGDLLGTYFVCFGVGGVACGPLLFLRKYSNGELPGTYFLVCGFGGVFCARGEIILPYF